MPHFAIICLPATPGTPPPHLFVQPPNTHTMSELISEKYPRTYHFPFSEGAINDDRIQAHWQQLLNGEVVVSEKLDGENTCIKSDGVYARSHGAVNRNPWARPIWEIWERVGRSLGDVHVFGENLYAIHSIKYARLPHYFFVFGVRIGTEWLSWDETVEYAQLLDLPMVPVLARGQLDAATLQQLIQAQQASGSHFGGTSEGVVCRTAGAFHNDDFPNAVLKFVRKNHVQTDEHWTRNWKKAQLYDPNGTYYPY